MSQLNTEINKNNFDPSHHSLTKRNAFMARMHRKFPSPPPQRIEVQLQSFSDPVIVYRFDAIEQLKQHLARKDLYGDLSKLNVHQDHRWDQTYLPPTSHMAEVTDGSWYQNAVSRYISGHNPHDFLVEDPYTQFLITLEQYQDSTGTDNKESFSLEPGVLSTGLLKSSYTSDYRSRFIIGYIPSFANTKSSASQSRRGATIQGFGCGVKDYHKCLSVILQPMIEAMKQPPILQVRLGDQVRHVRAHLLMAAVLGDGKSNDMVCGRIMSSSRTLRLSRATYTPSRIAADTQNAFHWIKTKTIEIVTRAATFDQADPVRSEWNRFLFHLPTNQKRTKFHAAAKRRARISTDILKKALGSHAVHNAFFEVNFASDGGVFGHSLADLMHLLEEGLMVYLLTVFFSPLSETILSNLDEYAVHLLGKKSNRCFGSRLFPRVNFTSGYTRLTLLASHERGWTTSSPDSYVAYHQRT